MKIFTQRLYILLLLPLLLLAKTSIAGTCTLNAGDIAFTGFTIYDDNTNGATRDDEFSFVILKPVSSGTVIYFTDFGWTHANVFQTAATGTASGSASDGIISWTASSDMAAGTQVTIKCKYAVTADVGTATKIQNTVETNGQAVMSYISLGIAGDQLFAYTGSFAAPAFLAGININRSAWDVDLTTTAFTSSESMLPTALNSVQNLSVPAAYNAHYDLSNISGSPSTILTSLNTPANWITDATASTTIPQGFDLPPFIHFTISGASFTTSSSTVCQGATGITYTMPNDPSVTSYTWTYSGTGVSPLTGTGNSITINFSNTATGGTLQATPIGNCGTYPASTVAVTVSPLPTQPAAFTAGPANVNAGQTGVTYTVPNDASVTGYLWTYSGTGVSPLTGTGNSITVDFSNTATSGILSVMATNNCGNSIARTINITVASLQTITFNPVGPVTYGAVDFDPGATASSLLPVTYSSSNTSVATITGGGLIHVLSAGSTIITASQLGNGSFAAATPVQQTLTVNPAALTITADDQSITYGSALPTLTVSFTGFVNGDNAASLTTFPTVNTTATAASPVGNYAITASAAVDNNYTITYVPGTLHITKAALTITADDQSITYGSALPTLTVSFTGFVNGDNAASLATFPTVNTTATSASPVGNYAITASAAVDNNYTITYVAGTLHITKAALTITADDQSITYGSALPTLTVSFTGFVNGDNAASLATFPTVNTTATSASPVGNYAITASAAVDNNYTITYVAGTLHITKAALTITADDQSITYGSALPTLTVSFTGFVNGDNAASLTTFPTVNTTATSASPVGNYAITASAAVDNNYTITYVAGTLHITKAALTITADDQSITYGSALPTLTVSFTGFVNGDNAASLTTFPTVNTTATSASPVGNYAITASAAVDNNYTITYVPGTLHITKAALTITADDQSITYGSALPTLTVSFTGFVNGDNAASLTTFPTVNTTATSASPVGNYAITASAAVDNNYTITYVAGTLHITKAALTITADDQSITYGSALPTLTVSFTGFVNGDNAASLATFPTVNTTATSASPVGNYAITASAAVDNNYTITYVPGTLHITKAALTITADNKTIAHGDPIPLLTVSFTGFVNGDNAASLTTFPTVTTTATVNSPAGGYPITATDAVDNNYTITYVPGTLTINGSLPVTFISFTASKQNDNVVLQWQTTEEINNDHFDVEFSTDGHNWTAIGSVPASTASSSVYNYSFTHNNPGTGKLDYRLKQVDHNGTFSYSNTVTVEFTADISLHVFPNPATTNIKATFESGTITLVQLIDMNGRMIEVKEPGEGATEVNFNVATYANGVYYLRFIHNQTIVTTRKFIKGR